MEINQPINLDENSAWHGMLKDNRFIIVPCISGTFMAALYKCLIGESELPIKIKGEIKIVPEISDIIPVIILEK